ncbi:hypothetical protein C0R09_15030 [Brevibacillus laterosporus]|uniref:DUF3885 domain-containing protein n=1 Tax=Brevibacillus laterosporus TaxID=1465 RepID=UPI000C75FB5D|nr:DUF3885 domain-containing protein [Brevibacillus laterosporus]AUM65724.1 hypothetical protein C0R09_15030 [Brevibacillus laterosporus]
MELKKFMEEHYHNLKLMPDFYHLWGLGIHVELGDHIYQLDRNGQLNMDRFYRVYEQVSEITSLLFQQKDDVIVVVNSYPNETKKTAYPNFFKRYVKNQKLKYSLRLHEYYWQDDEENEFVQQMELFCKVSDLKLEWLLKTLIHKDFYELQPRLRKKGSFYEPDVFLVNINTNCIFHLYDDRGCEIMNTNRAYHQELMNYFKEWETQSKS